jgi:signal transduction histidine kinase
VPIRVRRLDDAVVTGDALRLQQLVLNLLDNALRVSPEDGQIDVALGTDGAGATLTVSDRGPGIPPERLDRIFDRFYSAPGGSTSTAGTGLGLAIAREIARAHGGELTAHNRPGGGATLRLALPGHGASPNLHATLIAPSPHERTVAMTNDQPTGGR